MQVFKSYGWTLPPILISLLFATGPKAFLMALALPLGQSTITLAFKTISGKPRSKQKRNARGMNEGYQSWTVDNDYLNESDQGTSSFGGWDELDGMGSMRTPSAVENGRQQTAKVKDKSSMEQSKSNEPFLLRL
ncbi:hypothetical protein F3Y22_tig00000778pilonHSYRG00168 [Hibiscus syriacus]|uniref:Uncharacterized protein n=1 Tax=Hibiscus syriacus TaxID=106335 RepID=A0A6A3D3X6_HIBSY|nr:hypothetical protein F3Y22_tig00000778pilonHSYRG00168 [Hibiscus syriacus]